MDTLDDALLPEGLPSGRELAEEGRRIGHDIVIGRTAFCAAKGLSNEADHKQNRAAAGELTWSMIMGLGSIEEQIEGLHYLHESGRRSGVIMDRGLVIPNMRTGVPRSVRHRVPRGTSFVLDGPDDHVRIAQAVPIQPCFNDWHIGSPAAVDNTVSALRAGSTYHGVLAQFVWSLPYCEDAVANVAENVKAIGIVAAKRKEKMIVDSYMDDGMPSQFMDNASLVGYARLERYVVEDLCGARYATGFGGLMSNLAIKVAVWLALYEVLRADHPPLSYLYGNTIDPSDEQIVGNFGIVASEMLILAATEKHYRTGISLLPVPATEKIQVPTREEIADAHAVARTAAARSDEVLPMLHFTEIERMSSLLVVKGMEFFNNILVGLKAGGVDIRDPLQVLLAVRRLGAARLESLYHPGERDAGQLNGIVPFVRTELTQRSLGQRDAEIEAIRREGLGDAIRGTRFVVGSADSHSFGAFVLSEVLKEFGAEVVDGGIDLSPEQMLALAREHKGAHIAVSAHNGQSLGWGARLVGLARERGEEYGVFMGGRLNGVVADEAAPVDVAHLLEELDIAACRTVRDLADRLAHGRYLTGPREA